jgi:hypothetical protein
MSDDPEKAATVCLEFIDAAGAPPMSKENWIDMLGSIIDECRMRKEAAEQELENEEEDDDGDSAD